MQIRWIAQRGQTGPQLRERQRQHALDLCGVDRDGGRGQVLTEQLLGDEAAEGVSDDDRWRLEPVDDVGVVADGVVDPDVGDVLGVRPRLGHGVGFMGPAGCDRVVAGIAEQLLPRLPAGCV